MTLDGNEFAEIAFELVQSYVGFLGPGVQSTMKKDMEDEASGRKEQVLNEIRTAYLHPALHDVTLDVEHNSNTERLLPASSAFDDTPPV
jgi:hypothetical protein